MASLRTTFRLALLSRRVTASSALPTTCTRSFHLSRSMHESEEDTRVFRPKLERVNEDIESMRGRLVYQSRKRGIKENDLLMSTFCSERISGYGEDELKQLDMILNDHDNEWDMFYWMTSREPLPEYLSNSSVMLDLVEFVKNKHGEERIVMPPLKAKESS